MSNEDDNPERISLLELKDAVLAHLQQHPEAVSLQAILMGIGSEEPVDDMAHRTAGREYVSAIANAANTSTQPCLVMCSLLCIGNFSALHHFYCQWHLVGILRPHRPLMCNALEYISTVTYLLSTVKLLAC